MSHTLGPLELESQVQIEHVGDYCTLSTSVKYPGGIMQINQRIQDTPGGYREGKKRVGNIIHCTNTHPALLEALKGIIEYRDRVGPLEFQLEKMDDRIFKARKAIAQAEGRS